MSKTATTVLIVAGVAVGAYVLVKALAPAKTTNTYSVFGGSSSSTAAGITQGVIQGFGNLFGGSSSSSSHQTVAAGYNPTPQQVRQIDSANVTSYDAQGTADAPVVGIAGLDY